jgi:tetratricopeptide (TPR) repeat protein
MGHAQNAMVRLLKAVAFHQNAPGLFAALVQACRYCGQLDASLAAHRRALELDPNARTSVTHTYFLLGDYERSLFWYGTVAGFYLDALVLACMGREQEALALLWTRQEKFPLMPGGMQSLLAYLEGDHARGVAILRASTSDHRPDPEMYFYLARQAARFNEPDLANQLLQQSVRAGFWSTSAFLRDPWLESIRSTVEFNRTFDLAKQREEQSTTAFLAAGGEEILS